MKSSLTISKDAELLQNMNNYYEEISCEAHLVNDKYTKLIAEYLLFANENNQKNTNSYSNFILIRGVDTITHVFLMIFYYTKNIDLTYIQCQKSFYYFLEFISQITEEQHAFLQLSTRDASTYVYKKTIYEISNDFKKNIKQPSTSAQQKFEIINKYIEINKMVLYEMIMNSTTSLGETVDLFIKLSNKLNIPQIGLIDLNICLLFIESTFSAFKNNETNSLMLPYINIIILYLKKVSKNLQLIKKSRGKFYDEEFNIQLENDGDKFIFWLFSS
jgi:hypothetical protein